MVVGNHWHNPPQLATAMSSQIGPPKKESNCLKTHFGRSNGRKHLWENRQHCVFWLNAQSVRTSSLKRRNIGGMSPPYDGNIWESTSISSKIERKETYCRKTDSISAFLYIQSANTKQPELASGETLAPFLCRNILELKLDSQTLQNNNHHFTKSRQNEGKSWRKTSSILPCLT